MEKTKRTNESINRRHTETINDRHKQGDGILWAYKTMETGIERAIIMGRITGK